MPDDLNKQIAINKFRTSKSIMLIAALVLETAMQRKQKAENKATLQRWGVEISAEPAR